MSELDLDHIVDTFIDMKRMACEREGGPDDLIAMMHYQGDDGATVVAMPDGTTLLRGAVAMCRERFGPPKWIAFMSDAHVQLRKQEEGQDMPQRGELARRFGDGDLSIGEALLIYVVRGRGDCVMRVVDYTYDDQGQPVFTNREMDYEGAAGAVPEALATAFG